MTLEQVIAGASCWRCVPDFAAAELFLLNAIATDTAAAAAAAGQVSCQAGAPVAAPLQTCAWNYDLSNGATYYWDGLAWQLKA